jgi:DNA replication and repair protein RecF
LHLEELSIVNFKNYESADLSFSRGVNCISGKNGVGKTNLLDAIYYLALTKSYFNPIDNQMLRHGEKMMMVKGTFDIEGKKEKVTCGIRSGQKKMVKRNQREYEKIAEHIGLIPLVIITPFDSYLILEGSDVRRKFMDGIISQENKSYLQNLLHYNRALQQRNLLLKHFSREHHFDKDALEIWNEKLIEFGEPIFELRNKFIENFVPVFQEFYSKISVGKEDVTLQFKSSLAAGDFRGQLEKNLNEDLLKQYTGVGIHKDDLVFSIDGYPLKKFASQGQQKTFLLALKLAQFRQMQDSMGKTPILLLDDIYDKLDEWRMRELMKVVSEKGFEQIFITDTHSDRVVDFFKDSGIEVKSYEIEEGGIING